MLLSLVKKDFILVKKYALFMAAVCFLLPVFLLSRLPEFAGPLTFFISVVYYHISSSPVCFSERIPVSESRPSSVCFSLSPAAYGTGKICDSVWSSMPPASSDLLDQYAGLSGTWQGFIGKWLF